VVAQISRRAPTERREEEERRGGEIARRKEKERKGKVRKTEREREPEGAEDWRGAAVCAHANSECEKRHRPRLIEMEGQGRGRTWRLSWQSGRGMTVAGRPHPHGS
jgi:hypothetical protein